MHRKAVQQAVAAIEKYVGSDPHKRGELGESAQLVLSRKYGGRPPIITQVPSQRAYYAAWAEKYFDPEFLRGR